VLKRIEHEISSDVALDRCVVSSIEPGDTRVGTSTVVTIYGRFLADAVDVTFPRERVSTTVLDAEEDRIRVRLNINPDSMTGRHDFQILTLRGVVKSDEFGVYFHVRSSGSGSREEEDKEDDYGVWGDMGIGGDLL